MFFLNVYLYIWNPLEKHYDLIKIVFYIKYVIKLAISQGDINVYEQNTIRFYCKNIRMSGIEMANLRLKNKQSKSCADGFMLSV